MVQEYRFSFGPWNIHEGADPFGPPVRPTIECAEKFKLYEKLGFAGVQFHDDDAVPDLDNKSPSQAESESKALGRMLKDMTPLTKWPWRCRWTNYGAYTLTTRMG